MFMKFLPRAITLTSLQLRQVGNLDGAKANLWDSSSYKSLRSYHIPRLETLTLIGMDAQRTPRLTCPTLRSLHLDGCSVSIVDFQQFSTDLPSVRTLVLGSSRKLCNNDYFYYYEKSDKRDLFPNLRRLEAGSNFEDEGGSEWASIDAICKAAPKIDSLHLSVHWSSNEFLPHDVENLTELSLNLKRDFDRNEDRNIFDDDFDIVYLKAVFRRALSLCIINLS